MQFVNMLFPGLPKSILERKTKKRTRNRKATQRKGTGKGKGQVKYAICEDFFFSGSLQSILQRKGTGQGKERTPSGKEKDMELDR